VKGISGAVGFVRTVEAGSFAGAAKKLGITPVAVSKNVQRLEQRLGGCIQSSGNIQIPFVWHELEFSVSSSEPRSQCRLRVSIVK